MIHLFVKAKSYIITEINLSYINYHAVNILLDKLRNS